jgi:hypothetical protein
MRYYDIKRHWTKRIESHLADERLNAILVRDFNKFTTGRWGQPFKRGMFPRDFETCMWDVWHRGPEPRFWRYVKHAACHWLVNFNLRLARLAVPRRQWRIVTSQKHSTVWDGGRTLFDMNFLALGVPSDEAFELADRGRRLPPGKELRVYPAAHFSEDLRGRPAS